MPPDRPVLLAHDDQVPVAGGDAGQYRARVALGRTDGHGDVARQAADRGLERVADQLGRCVTLLGAVEEQDNTRVRQVPAVAAAVPGQAQCP
jgi:hypothetical protein